MIETIISFIQDSLLPLGALGVFIASLLEEVVAPIPSALVQLGSGFLFVSGPITLAALFRLIFIVVIPAALGVTLGSIFVYEIAFYAGKPVLLKWGKWLGLSWADVEKIQAKFSEGTFDEWALTITRSVPIIPSVAVSAFCGLVRFPIKSYLFYSFIGTLVRASFLGFVGWQAGSVYFKYAKIISSFENIVLVCVVLGVGVFIIWRLVKSRKLIKNNVL